jgi:hypothetical protein
MTKPNKKGSTFNARLMRVMSTLSSASKALILNGEFTQGFRSSQHSIKNRFNEKGGNYFYSIKYHVFFITNDLLPIKVLVL